MNGTAGADWAVSSVTGAWTAAAGGVRALEEGWSRRCSVLAPQLQLPQQQWLRRPLSCWFVLGGMRLGPCWRPRLLGGIGHRRGRETRRLWTYMLRGCCDGDAEVAVADSAVAGFSGLTWKQPIAASARHGMRCSEQEDDEGAANEA